MLISVILPTYNGERFINRAISGVLNQSYSDLELLVLDDGSTDNTSAIVQGIAQGDPRVRYIKNEKNLGIQKSLNKGLREAKGAWIARIDDDDQWTDKEKIDKQVNFLKTHKGYILLGTGLITQDTKGKELYRFYNPRKDRDIRKKILYRNCFSHSTVMFSKEAALKAGGYSESAHALHIEDYDLWLRLGMIGKFANIRDYAVRLTIHKSSISAVHKIVQFKKQLEITHQLDFLKLPYHRMIMNDQIPLSIGGGIGQSRTYMYLLRTAHLGEVSVTVWPQILKDMSAKKNIHVLE